MHPYLLKQQEDPDFINELFTKEDKSVEMVNVAADSGSGGVPGDDDGNKSINWKLG